MIASTTAHTRFARGELPRLLRPPLLVTDPFAMQASPGDSEERDVITRQLHRSDSLLKEHQGFAQGEALRGALAQDDSMTTRLRLAAGREYVIAGYCDEHCGQLSLTLRSPQRRVIDADIEIDDTPKLRFVAPMPGSYELVIGMTNCDAKTCKFGVRTYTIERRDRP